METMIKTALSVLAILLPAIASAHDFEVDGIYYNINGNQATVTYQGMNPSQYVEYSGQIVIPETVTHDGVTYQVTTIGPNNSVTTIGNGAFSYCDGMTNVTLGNTVRTIGTWAFSGCSSLTTLTIPNSVISIGESAFNRCSGLTSVTMGNAVTTVGKDAFVGCSALQRVNVDNIACWSKTNFENDKANPLYFAHHLYQNGTGRVSLVGKDTLTWQDDQEHKGDGLLFVPLSSPLGGGL